MKVEIKKNSYYFGPHQLVEKLSFFLPKEKRESSNLYYIGDWYANTPVGRGHAWLANKYVTVMSAREVKVKIDPWDTWSMDHTLAPIILPMLKQLKETKHGAPDVDMKDVPKELRANKKQIDAYNEKGDLDPKFFERWEWVLDEMIWAFEQKCRDHWQSDYYGTYVEQEGGMGFFEWEDREGLRKHQERMSNGFRLFGTYFENLWD